MSPDSICCTACQLRHLTYDVVGTLVFVAIGLIAIRQLLRMPLQRLPERTDNPT